MDHIVSQYFFKPHRLQVKESIILMSTKIPLEVMRYCNKINYRFDIFSSKRCPVNIDFWCIIMKESHNRCTVPLSPILIMLNGWRPALYISITPIKESLSSLLSAGFSNCRVISIKTATDLVSCCPITTVNNHHGETIYVKLWKWTNLINERSLTTSFCYFIYRRTDELMSRIFY